MLKHSKDAILKTSMGWTVETLNATVDKELEALPADPIGRQTPPFTAGKDSAQDDVKPVSSVVRCTAG